MKKPLLIAGLTAVLALSSFAQAKEVNLTTQLTNYGGDGAYVAIYLTDASGDYKSTLWVAGRKSKYYKHLRDWARGSGLKSSEYDGLTGASITQGKTLTMTVDIDDALFDNGNQIRIDTSVEDMRDNRSDVVAELTTDGAGKPVKGKAYVKSFTYDF